jgi:glycosyltransferase involved in cell wall biosynthesis
MTATDKPIIAIFLNAFWVHGKGMSGGDQMALQVFARIRDSFHAIHWFTNPDGRDAVELVVSEARVSATPAWFDCLPIGLAYVLRTIYATVSLHGKLVDIVYSGSDFFPDVLPGFLYTRIRRNTRWVQCVFHIYPDWRKRPGNKVVNFVAAYLQRISIRLARCADGVISINTEVREALIAMGFDASKVVVITPGIDLEKIIAAPLTNELLPYDAVFLGRLNPSKGIFDLPLIWEKVMRQDPRARLAIIGGGSETMISKLNAEIEAKGLCEHIHLLGYVETEKIYSIMKQSCIFVFPSYEEGFGIAIAEALACAKPVVAWDLPVYRELFGDVISTVTIGNHQTFADSICELLRDTKTGANTDLTLRGNERARRYSWTSVSQQMLRWLISHEDRNQ